MSHLEQFQHLKIQLEAIKTATNNFSANNCIGQGGFGRVYRGELVRSMDETMVALKRLDRAFGQGNSEFWKEIMLLSFYKHENIVSLLGYCDEHDEKILVYEYASKKSLDSYLASDNLMWVQRLKICIGAACGLAYLHTPGETQQRILHRDIKSSNILLDDNWNAKISDFGLSKLAPANNQFTFMISNPTGTFGYIDPLYHETGLLTKESDVYSFGVVLFEVLCGRLCFGNKNLPPLIGLVREYYEQNKISELVYNKIKDEIDTSSLSLFAQIAYQCLKREREERPLMTDIVSVLKSALDTQEKADAKAKGMTRSHRGGILNVKVIKTTYATSENTSILKDIIHKTWVNPFAVPDHYMVLYVNDRDPVLNIKETLRYKEKNAEWINEEFTLNVESFASQSLCILVNNVVSEKTHGQLGMAIYSLTHLTPEIGSTCDLYVTDKNNKEIAHLIVEMLYQPTNIEDVNSSVQKAPIRTPKDGGLLVIIIKGAYLFSENDNVHSSVLLFFKGEIRKTKSMKNTKRPMWLQQFSFMLEQPPTHESLRLDVIKNSWKGLIHGKESIGSVLIDLADVVNEKWTNQSYQLEGGDSKENDLYVELQWKTSD